MTDGYLKNCIYKYVFRRYSNTVQKRQKIQGTKILLYYGTEINRDSNNMLQYYRIVIVCPRRPNR